MTMLWPEKPTCHAVNPVFITVPMEWKQYEPQDEYPRDAYRHCSYCGCLHPEDLLTILEQPGSRLGGSDWKYGWPHKFYVYAPNPDAGKNVQIGSVHHPGKPEEKLYGPASNTLTLKWYNEHLQDTGYNEDALQALLKALSEGSGIEWGLQDGRVQYKAPHPGFQR